MNEQDSQAAQECKPPSQSAKNRVTRLVSVQAIYEIFHNKKPMKQCVSDYLAQEYDTEIEGEELVKPDGALLQKILYGVDERRVEMDEIISTNLSESNQKEPEFLLKAILLCAVYELMAHHEIDAPIIINDYLDVTHSFYEDNQVKLVNGILDNVSKLLR